MAKEKAEKKEKVVKAKKEPRDPKTVIANTVKDNIREGLTWEQSKAVIDKKHPGNKHSKACYYWYRNKLKSLGEKVPDLPKKEKKAKEPKAKAAKKSKKSLPATSEALAEAVND